MFPQYLFCGETRCRCLGVLGRTGEQPLGPPCAGRTVPVRLQVRAPALPSTPEPFAPAAPSSAPQQHRHRGPHSSRAGVPPVPHIPPGKAPQCCLLGPGGEDLGRGSGTSTTKAQAPGDGGLGLAVRATLSQAGSPQPPSSSLTPASLLSFAHRSSVCIS